MPLNARLRFEILRRDSHTCRYCGGAAPDVRLHVDHVIPEALGGSSEPDNLVTSCEDCNGGKASIAPDSPIVEDVARDAMRWNRAMAKAADMIRDHRQDRAELMARFDAKWHCWDFDNGDAVPRPGDWRQSIDQFVTAGLAEEHMHELVDVAMASGAKTVKVWRYFCGCCWNAIKDLQDTAMAVLEVEDITRMIEEERG